MKYRLIVSDYDDTLSRHDGTISPRTKQTIARFREKGGKFVVSSGRIHNDIVNHCLNRLGITEDIPVISCQGAIIRMAKIDKVLRFLPIKREIAIEVLKLLEAENLHLHICIGRDSKVVCNYDGNGRANLTRNSTVASNVIAASDMDCTRIIVIGEPKRIEQVKTRLRERYSTEICVDNTWEDFLEVYSVEAGKGNALKFIADYYSIPLEETAAFGDSNNDAGMIALAGLGVAVANASNAARAAANFVTQSSECDGVALAIEKYIL